MSMNSALWSLSAKWNRGSIPAALTNGWSAREMSMKSIQEEAVSRLGGCPTGPCLVVIGSTSAIRLIQEENLLLCFTMDSFASMRTMISCPFDRSVVIASPRSESNSCLGLFGFMPNAAAIMYW